jgi:hypothetical protein
LSDTYLGHRADMTRILLRSRKGPFEISSPEATLHQNLVGTNSGNLLFSGAAHRILTTPGTEVVSNGFRADPADADRINDEYDMFVVPLANAFRLDFERHLVALTRLINRLTIPVVVFGVGAQAGLDYDVAAMDPIEQSVKDFAAAVLDRSASIGVRGEFTLDYLQRMGFRDVDVIGCPSFFLHGRGFRVDKRAVALDRRAKLAINVSPDVPLMGEVVRRHHAAYPHLRYVTQDLPSLDRLLWGEAPDPGGELGSIPAGTWQELCREDKVHYYVDPWPWIASLAEVDFAFGTRIHGSIAALLAGTPSVVLAHDSRTLELARYFDIPYRKITDVESDVDAADLYAAADFDAMNTAYPRRLDTMIGFLDRNGVDHIFAHGGESTAFDAQLRQTEFPSAVRPVTAVGTPDLVRRVRFLRDSNRVLTRRADAADRKARAADKRVAATERRVTALSHRIARLDQVAKRVDRLEAEVRAARASRWRRLRRSIASSGPGRTVAPAVRWWRAARRPWRAGNLGDRSGVRQHVP